MKYMLLVYINENIWAPGEQQQCYEESTRLAHDLHANGQFLAAAPLHPVATATSVRVREGKLLISDGPFAETREQLGGYYLINADNLDEAIAISARIPGAKKGVIEVRPVMEIPNVPPSSNA